MSIALVRTGLAGVLFLAAIAANSVMAVAPRVAGDIAGVEICPQDVCGAASCSNSVAN